jgi:hypothetical protein
MSERGNEQEQLAAYRRIRDALYAHIAVELLLPAVRKAIPLGDHSIPGANRSLGKWSTVMQK